MIQNLEKLKEAAGLGLGDRSSPGVIRTLPEGFKLYIAGPMSGIADHNFPAFRDKAAELRDLGLIVVNPAELHGGDRTQKWSWYLRRDVRAMMDCEGLYMLEGWTNSEGASFEFSIAQKLEMEIVFYDQQLKVVKA